MYLLSKTQTVLIAVLLSAISVGLVIGLINDIAKNSIPSIIFSIILLVLYARMWGDFAKAFKRRMYDRSYAKEKIKLYDTLISILPEKGAVEVKNGEIEIEIFRRKSKLLKDSFLVIVSEKSETTYDEDTLTHTVTLAEHRYYVYRRKMSVDKYFDVGIARVKKELDSSNITVIADTPPVGVSNLRAVRAIMKTPEELRIASVEEMRDLNTLLVDSERGIVS